MKKKASKRQPEKGVVFRKKLSDWTISLAARSKGSYRFVLVTSDPQGKRKERWFAKKGEGLTAAEKIITDLENHGARHAMLGDDERAALIKWRTWAEGRTDTPRLSDIITKAIRDHEQAKAPWTLNDAVTDRLAAAKRAGASQRHQDDLRERLDRFKKSFGTRQLASLTGTEIESWLYGLNLSAGSFANFRRVIFSVFALASKKSLIESNPVTKVTSPKIKRGAPTIITPEQLARLLLVAQPALRAMLVLQAFCGCRRAEANRLRWELIHLDEEPPYLELPDAVTKTHRRRTSDIPPCAIEWLRPLRGEPSDDLGLTTGKYRFRLEEAAAAAGIEWSENILRHAFGSYRMATTRNAALVAAEMGNSPAVVHQHYVNLVSPKRAAEYWALTPATAAAVAQK